MTNVADAPIFGIVYVFAPPASVELMVVVFVVPSINWLLVGLMVRAPVIVSPVLSTLSEAEPVTLPVKLAVIVPALKLPEPSRNTIVDAVLLDVAVVFVFGSVPLTWADARLIADDTMFLLASSCNGNDAVKTDKFVVPDNVLFPLIV